MEEVTHLEIPPCPTCGATGERCLRPSGHAAARWHVEREDALARQCMCAEVCRPWLRRRLKRAGERADT